MKEIEGGICAVKGVRAWGMRQGKYGLALISCSGTAAGSFTTNKVRAAPLEITAEHLQGGRLDGIIANSGCANAFTGSKGLEDAREMARIMASKLGCDKGKIALASTGVIGRYLDLDLIRDLAEMTATELKATPEASKMAAQAIMTTDTVVKEVAVEHKGIRMGCICKGAGMIEPHMATMLAFIFTDAAAGAPQLKRALDRAVEESFNMLSVDGDTSTNDMVVLTATGQVSCSEEVLQEALTYVCCALARKMARDGEGASKYMETVVTGASSLEDARMAARAVARSNLVKCALYGEDPNWGRIVCAVGRSGADVDPSRISLRLSRGDQGVILVDRGSIVHGVLDRAKEIMHGDEVLITVDLGLGEFSARSFGCDLTHEYVDINASYTT